MRGGAASQMAKRPERGLPELEPIGLHEARHSFVSMMIDAGLSLERIGDYTGHSSAWMTDGYRTCSKGTRRRRPTGLPRTPPRGRPTGDNAFAKGALQPTSLGNRCFWDPPRRGRCSGPAG